MADSISTYRYVPHRLFDERTTSLMGCEDCSFIWAEPLERVGEIDGVCTQCPHCRSRKTDPLYFSGETNNRGWAKLKEVR